jgi:Zn-dependent protease
MAYPDYESPELQRFLRTVMRTFAVGTFFGVHVRMYWAGAILVPLMFMQALGLSWMGLAESLLFSALLFLVIWSHEMGHIAAGWHFRIRTDLITLSPLGGVAHMNAPARTPHEELWITLAGPAVHLVWLAVFWPLYLLLPAWSFHSFVNLLLSAVWFLKTTNLTLLVFNLLPIFSLDGGRVARALLSFKWHANRVTMWVTSVGMAGGFVLIVLALWRASVAGSVGLLIGISCIGASLQERRRAQHVMIYQQHRREIWETDGDAWKYGGMQERRPGWFARWRRRRAERRARTRAEAIAALDREVDVILGRVREVGLPGLTERERAVLRRASKLRRDTG